MEIRAVNQDRMLWDKTIKLAENCSFPAVHRLSDRMRINDFADWERVIAAAEDGSVAGFCVLEENGNIPDNSEKMIRFALDYAEELGYKKVYTQDHRHHTDKLKRSCQQSFVNSSFNYE